MSTSSKAPDFLYRYRSLKGQQKEWVKDAVLNSKQYFSSPREFNDPFDCRPILRLSGSKEDLVKYYEGVLYRQAPKLNLRERREVARSLIGNSQSNLRNSGNLARMHELYEEMVIRKIGVLCLSETCRDILMWSHYADSHRGICLKFCAKGNIFATSQPVRYSKSRPLINPVSQTQDEMLDHAIFTKSEHWSYEQEWRLIQYEKGAGIYKVPRNDLAGIVLGALITEPDKHDVLRWVKGTEQPLVVYQAKISSTNFELEIDELHT